MKKTCKDCGLEKNTNDFYGVQGECKECTRKRVSAFYRKNIERYKRYDMKRNKEPERKANRLKYQQRYRAKNPQKYLARQKAIRALARGDIVKEPCGVCGSKNVEAHHEDHAKPLEVVWLCRKHHREVDRLIIKK